MAHMQNIVELASLTIVCFDQ